MAEDPNLGLKKENETPGDQPVPEKTPQPGSEPIKTPEETPEAKAERILKDGTLDSKEIKIPKEKYDDRNDKAKLYETFAPLIDKLKDNPALVEELLETKKKGSLEDRISQMEDERKSELRNELKNAVVEALSKWKGFEKDWVEIKEDVEKMVKKGHSAKDAIRRHYLALRPEEVSAEAERIARENANAAGQFQSGAARSPNLNKETKEVNLNERERKVVQDLLGKDYGAGFVPVKSEEDYANLLKKHDSYLRARGFYDLP